MDFRSFLIWPHARSRVRLKIRPGCSELYTMRSWKLSGMHSTWIVWPICSSAVLFSEWKSFFLISSLNLPYFSQILLPLFHSYTLLLVNNFCKDPDRLLLGYPQAIPSPSWRRQLLQLLLPGQMLQASTVSVALPWTDSSLLISFLYRGNGKTACIV